MKQNINAQKKYFLSLLFVVSTLFSFQLVAQCDPISDSLALVALYNTTNGDNWQYNSNWLEEGMPVSAWYGVEINDEGCVVSIELGSNHLVGFIPPEIENLTNLVSLSLSGNTLYGFLPSEIGNLNNLTYLALRANDFSDVMIPDFIFEMTSLLILDLSHLNFSGDIPFGLLDLSNLESLYLVGNDFSGNIPPELAEMLNLTRLNLSKNDLSGSIPVELAGMPNLATLDLASNNLYGSIPVEMWDSNIKRLLLGSNQLTGSLPSEIGNLTGLTYLSLFDNQFTGSIPPEIGNLTELTDLRLGRNQFSGSIPPEIGNLTRLGDLSLFENQLTGNIPPEIENMGSNNIWGEVHISLSINQLTGSIPAEIGNMSFLRELHLNHNNLSGNIPIEIAELPILNYIYLNDNQLTGTIYPEFGNIPYLRLFLNNNQLTGKLPIELASGNLLKLQLSNNQLYGCIPPQYEVFCGTDFSVENNPGLPNNGDLSAFCQDGSGACQPNIIGRITFDENLNCSNDNAEIGLQNWMVKANSVNNGLGLYGMSDTDGHYSIYTNPGEYTVELIQAGPYWEENCTDEVTVNVIDSLSLNTVDFYPNAIVDCPFMTTDISTPRLRRCFSGVYTVNYCNKGTLTAENAYIEVVINDLINIDSTSIPSSEQIDQTLIFDLGDVAPNECGAFTIHTNVDCDAELGQTLCATAHIYPDSICADISPEWSGATIAVEGTCEGDEVHFEIKNIGDGDMQAIQSFMIIEDALILLEMPETFILNSEEAIDINLPANGSTYTLRAMQVDNHPIPSMPTVFVEGCGTNSSGGFSTGFVTQFPEDDNAPFMSIDCQKVIGSFDPNDKNGYPKGYADEHFIEKGQDIEYHIRFQNTGTDTAFTVMVEDVISPYLEMTSLKLGASSHPYVVEFGQHNELQFIFENILLVDSFANEAASHGFVKFKISQKADLLIGTQIENTAAIFFDFNEAVITNTTLHTIGEAFVEIVATEQPFIPNLEISLAPNPVVNEATIRLSGVEFKNAQLSLFNAVGVLVKQGAFIGNEFSLKKADMPAGVYFFEVVVDHKKGFMGKLVIQ